MTYENIKNDPAVRCYIEEADASLIALGFTEHSFPHVTRTAVMAGQILEELGYCKREAELARIAGFLHDIGNLVNRIEHSQSGAILAFSVLKSMDFPPEEIAKIISAIGNHDEGTGTPVNAIAAALILADKSDVRRSRVRNNKLSEFDIHDRVNYSVTESKLSIHKEQGEVRLSLIIDTEVSSVMEYFEIFLARMLLCQKAAKTLGLQFRLHINNQSLL